jgi:hypothetical protein
MKDDALNSTDFTYPKMRKMNGHFKFRGKYKLEKDYFYMGLHTAYRKALDTNGSCLVWNAMNELKNEHINLLRDTFFNILPHKLDIKDEAHKKSFCRSMAVAWNIFFDRLQNREYPVKWDIKIHEHGRIYDSRIAEYYKNTYSDLYKTVVKSLEIGVKLDAQDNPFEYFTDFIYNKE